MSFGLNNFKQSPLGQKVGDLLNDPQTISDMIAVSKYTARTPAVQVLGKSIIAFGMPVTDGDKMSIGRWVREVLEDKGWTTDITSKGRVAPDNLFSTGAIYYPKSD
jgi:hypothetical protein